MQKKQFCILDVAVELSLSLLLSFHDINLLTWSYHLQEELRNVSIGASCDLPCKQLHVWWLRTSSTKRKKERLYIEGKVISATVVYNNTLDREWCKTQSMLLVQYSDLKP